jgi:3-hydroxybutyryl-CoA dehydratase
MGALAAPFEELVEGARFETRGRTITEADVVSFSALTRDWHPQNADAAWAARSAFGERIAHPWAWAEEARSADARR